jgi:TonB family protein
MASAVDTRRSRSRSPAKSHDASLQPSRKTNPVAHEVQLIATGARPGDSGGQRELFTEETSTVLVFENGGVIRLSAAVAAGQLLFLTNKETRREVVAQVTRKRDFRPTSCYVEVGFTEPSSGFWGIEFPDMPELVPANAQQKEAAELVQAAPAVAGEPGAPAPAPSAHEVTALKQEVEALREQLKLLQTQAGAGNSSAPAPTPDPPPPPYVGASSEQSQNLSSAASEAPASVAVPAPRVSATLPIDRDEPQSSEENVLAKPVIRVNRAKPPATRPLKQKETSSASDRPGTPRIARLFAALLLIAAGAAWYFHWIPWLSRPKKLSAGAASNIVAHSANAVSATPQKTADAHSDSGKTTPAIVAPMVQPGLASQDAPQPVPAAEAGHPALAMSEPPAAPGDAAVDVAAREKSVDAVSAGKRPGTRPASQTSVVSQARLSDGTAIIPPKLIKSVRAIASPNALQYFDKGNTATVTLDAAVDSSGHVKSMKVLSGPASLRSAAMDALKQYRYEPAKLRGKPVAARVTVKVEFLFEP